LYKKPLFHAQKRLQRMFCDYKDTILSWATNKENICAYQTHNRNYSAILATLQITPYVLGV
jgi:hypothetical protein